MQFLFHYWFVWIIGLIVFPLFAVLPQIKNIHAAIDDKGAHPEEIGKLFVTPKALLVSIIGGMGTFVCFVLFLASVLLALIQAIKE